MKKGWIIFLLLVLVVSHLLLLVALERQRSITGFFFSKFFKAPGLIQSLGEVALFVLSKFQIIIYSPQSLVYFNQTLDLNVSADTEISLWQFSLKRLNGSCAGQVVYDGAGFVPNISFTAVRGMNELTVFALATSGEQENASVVFNVSVPNKAPSIVMNGSFVVCEGNEFSTFFDIVDENLDCIEDSPLGLHVNETPPFFVFVHSRFLNRTAAELFSGTLLKSEVGLHTPEITATDGDHVAYQIVTINVLPVNNAPVIAPIPVTTLEVYNTTYPSFVYQLPANDIEDGNSDSGNLSFTTTFLMGNPLFLVNGTGWINFSYNLSDLGVYRVRICVTDRGLSLPGESLTFCNESGANKSACFDWDFSITYVNRPPNITDYSNSKNGKNLSLEVRVGELVIFNMSAVDPDGNTPYLEWYFDSFLRRRNQSNTDEFFFVPVLKDVGEHQLTGVATDLLLNDSVVWNLTIIGPPLAVPGGGGDGGGGVSGRCSEKWGCTQWSTCQNASLRTDILETCTLFQLPEEHCGFQLRRCIDVKGCNITARKPKELQVCYFTLHPDCSDGIQNCHDGSCELLVDCGGPCQRCPTCSDGRKNQEEEGIDCGGPCPVCEIPFFDLRKRVGIAVNLFIFLALLLLLFIIYEVIRIRTLRQQYGKKIKKIVRTEAVQT